MGFVDKNYGGFNRDYLLHFQILGKPEEGQKVEVDGVGGVSRTPNIDAATELKAVTQGIDVPSKNSPKGLFSRFTKATGLPDQEADARQKAAWENVVAMTPLLWKPQKMGGAEYENGGFEAYVAARALEGDMVFDQIDLNFTTATYPDQEVMRYSRYGKNAGTISTLQKSWSDAFKIKAPERVEAEVYIIAPRDKMRAARDMLISHAHAVQEFDTHRGFDLREAVLYNALSDGQKKKMGDRRVDSVGWFEIHAGVFITTDKEMFEKAKTFFSASDANAKPEAEAKRSRWHSPFSIPS